MLCRLDIKHVRNLNDLSLQPQPGFNLISGQNGSGKTSLLEAIYLLGLARSFRTTDLRTLIASGQPEATVFGEILLDPGDATPSPMGVSRGRDGSSRIRFSGEDISVTELAALLPMQVVDSSAFELLDGSPSVRRHFVDWGVFHFSQSYLLAWRSFNRALQQRNSLLKYAKIDPSSQRVWDEELVRFGELVTQERRLYLEQFAPIFTSIVEQFLPDFDIQLAYQPGWDSRSDLAAAITAAMETDRTRGFTSVGPQRADLRIKADGVMAAQRLSRGQKKLVVSALKLAQGIFYFNTSGKRCIYLIDDLPAELDRSHRQIFCELLASTAGQSFVTSIEPEYVAELIPNSAPLVEFQLESGRLI